MRFGVGLIVQESGGWWVRAVPVGAFEDAREVSRDTAVNLMDQYRPHYQAGQHPPLDRRISPAEFRAACQAAARQGLHRFLD